MNPGLMHILFDIYIVAFAVFSALISWYSLRESLVYIRQKKEPNQKEEEPMILVAESIIWVVTLKKIMEEQIRRIDLRLRLAELN
jgi:hypothetical protein